MSKLDSVKKIVRDFSDVADFVFVYVEEAHPVDGWDYESNKYKIPEHKTVADRLEAAKLLADTGLPPCTLLIDTMENTAVRAYFAYPERLYVLENGKVSFVGGIGPFGYHPKAVREWLVGYKRRE